MFLYYLTQFPTLKLPETKNTLKNVYFQKPGKNLKIRVATIN